MRRIAVVLPVVFAFLVGAAPASAWTWPVEGPVMQPFSLGSNPYAGGQHRGIDVGASAGAEVRAPASGLVSFAGTVPRGGLTVTIRTEDGYAVTLVHLGAVSVAEGAAVGEGAVVGAVGPSGDAEHPAPYVHVGIRVAADENGYVDPLLLLPPAAGAPAQPDAAETPEQSMPEGESSDAPSPTPDETALPAEAETAESGPDADLGASASSSVQGEHAQTFATVSSGQVATEPQPAAAPAPEAASQANAVSETAIEPSLEPQPQVGEPEKGAGSPSLQVGAGGPSQAVDFAVVAPSTATERTRRVDRAKTGDAPSSGARTTAARAAGERAREAGGARHGRPTVPSSDGPDTAARTLGAHSGAGSAGDPTGQEDGEVPGQDRALRVSAGAALAAAALAGVVLLLWRPLSGSSRTPRDHPVPGRPGGAVTPAEAGESVAGTAAPDTPGRHLPLPAPPLIAAESQIVRLRSVEQLADAA